MKKLIKRLEELAVENERLSTENSELRKELLQEVRNKVSNELDKDEEIIRHPFTVVVEVAKDFANKIQEVADLINSKKSQNEKEQAESIVSDIFVDEIKKRLFEQMNDTGVTKDTSCFDGLLSKMQYRQDFKKRVDDVDEEERPKTTSTYEELGSQPKELEEAIEILKDWRFGKFTYSSDEIDIAIETILKHLDNENKK